MKKLILHVGTYKTGTTSIQNTLYKNSENLLHHGVNYLGHNIGGCGTKNGRQVFQNSLNHQEIENFLKSEPGEVHIFSNESLWDSTIVRNKIIPVILNSDIYSNVIVVSYIRRQSDFIESFYKQEQGFGSRWAAGLSPNDFYKVLIKKGTLDILGTLSSFEKLFGLPNMIVRPYRRTELVNRDVVDDFFYYCMPSNFHFERTQSLNQSISAQEALLSSIAYSFMKFKSKKVLIDHKDTLVSNFSTEFKDYFSNNLVNYIFTDTQKKEIDEKYYHDNCAVESKFNVRFIDL